LTSEATNKYLRPISFRSLVSLVEITKTLGKALPTWSHTSCPFLATRIKDSKVLLDDLEAGPSVGLPVENLQYRKLETHPRLRRYDSALPYM